MTDALATRYLGAARLAVPAIGLGCTFSLSMAFPPGVAAGDRYPDMSLLNR